MSQVSRSQLDDEVARLQTLLLQAVLRHESLPGLGHSIELPDLALVQADGVTRISTENFLGSLPIEGLPAGVRVVSPESLHTEACQHGDVKYLAFDSPERDETEIRLTLKGRIATCGAGTPTLGLSGLQVTFQRVGDHWEVDTPPAAFAE
jgi:hypothetical protein